MSGKVHKLEGEQAQAVNPRDSVWLSASAGTGKTQVLSARVLRLLLRGDVEPDQILCLTFTKAGAAEMATRVNEVLASWVRLSDTQLGEQLSNIGADSGPANRERARTLFASVLDCPGGGLRIDTIHAFAQWLLSAFPEEAGLIPGSRPMEDRDRELLSRQLLAEMLVEAGESGNRAFVAALEDLSIRLGPDGARNWLMRCAEARDAWFGPGGWQPPMIERTRQWLGLPSNASVDRLAELCADDAAVCRAVKAVKACYDAWNAASAAKVADPIAEWLAQDPTKRLQASAALYEAIFNDKDEPKWGGNVAKQTPEIFELAEAARQELAAVRDLAILVELAEWIAPALEAGRHFAIAWDQAKRREGLIDFDDQIHRAAELLGNSELAPWIRYKLDRQFDHVLIDEAQDTNEAQWSIIDALTDDFFSGLGQREGKQRTIFVVGDYKQAIFGFQGTSPQNFEQARQRYREIMRAAARNAASIRAPGDVRELVELGLGRSYRTGQPVLDFVDAAIATIGPGELGLASGEFAHKGDNRPGLVRMWQPLRAVENESEDEPEGPDWISEPERRMADRIAEQVKHWLDTGFPLVKDKRNPRNATPGDVMVLVRKRRELAGLIVARLHAAGVPVAGVDRLRLGAPLAVKDLMAALRFAAQPLDDLNLACLLVSPLIGWSQEQLLECGYRKPDVPLWHHLHDSSDPEVEAVVAQLRNVLARADFETPQALLHWLLVGPWRGRRNLVERLGSEANDPIDELVNAAFAYETTHTPSLVDFIRWFDAGDGELKRDSGETPDLVRVMTVHGSKGLQAPIVILADAAGNPDSSPTKGIDLPDPMDSRRELPLPPLRSAQQIGRIGEHIQNVAAAQRQEHWRLLYVAMTRAEEALFIGGALAKSEKEVAPDSWYARLDQVMTAEEVADPIWGMHRDWGSLPAPIERRSGTSTPAHLELPAWLNAPIGPEPRPPRPLAPSSTGEEQGADPPLPPDQARDAARRGVLMHRLLERLPELAPSAREEAAEAWLARQAADMEAAQRGEIIRRVLSVLDDPEFARVFGPCALAEVPLAATVGSEVIAGIADRLLVTREEVTVVDFKSARRPPQSLESIPASTVRQMAAYVAALEAIYPDRMVRAAVLYTQTPRLFALPAALLEAHKAALHIG